MAAVTASESYYQYPEWLMRLVHSDNSKAMIQAAEIYIIALSRLKLSIKNGIVDKCNKPYIFFTYKEIMGKFKCGTTKCWQMLKKLKHYGLITVKYQGFGLPMMIYVHGSAVLNRGDEPKIAALKKMAETHKKYAFLQNESFDEWQKNKIIAAIDEKTVGESDETKRTFADNLYNRFLEVEQKKRKKNETIENRYAYFYEIVKRAVFNKKLLKLIKSKSPPSFDLDLIMKNAREHTPVISSVDDPSYSPKEQMDIQEIKQEENIALGIYKSVDELLTHMKQSVRNVNKEGKDNDKLYG